MEKMYQKDINLIKDKAVKAAKNLDSVGVFRMFGSDILKRGNQTYVQCPNPDCGASAKSRDCSVGTTGLWHCFACKSGGGAPQAYHLLTGLTWLESCITLAYQVGAITDNEYNDLTKGSASVKDKLNSDTLVYQQFDEAKSIESVAVKAPTDRLDLVYRHLIRMPQMALNDEGYKHLLQRGLTSQEIMEEEYFSYDMEFSTKELLKSIQSEKPDFVADDFSGVPGFYFLFKNETNGWWVFTAPCPHSVGIPLRDSYGRIIALQMRNLRARKKDAKYFYLSSLTRNDKRGKTGYGCSTGTPAAISFPKGDIVSPICYIGEGHFKMKEIAKEGVVAISIQGINSYNSVADEVKQMMSCETVIEKSQNCRDHTLGFCIVFDSDMYHKYEVVTSCISLAAYLKVKFGYERDVSVMIWKPEYGKGYDDYKSYCIEHGLDYRENFLRISSSDYKKVADEGIKIAKERYLELYPGERQYTQKEEFRKILFDEIYVKRMSKLL